MNKFGDKLQGLSVEEKRALAAQLLRGKMSKDSRSWPLSYGQNALWFFYKMAPESSAYHVSFTCRVRTPVDIEALRQSFQILLDRHPVLSSAVVARDGRLLEEVREGSEIDLAEIDAEALSPEALRSRVASEYARPFNLEDGRALRVCLFRRGASDSVLLLVAHHLVCDLWGLLILLEELRVLLPQATSGRAPSGAPAGLQYSDYVRWQNQLLESDEGERLWNYWREKLSGDLPPLNLPTDRPRPPVQKFAGATHSFVLTPEISAGLSDLAKQNGTSLFVVLLSAFATLLHRYTQQEDFILGSLTSGRSRAELAGLVGHFMNPVALRLDFSGDPSFEQVAAQVRRTALEALANDEFPYSLLVDRLQPTRDASRSGLYDVMFILQQPHALTELTSFFLPDAEAIRVNFGGLEIEPFYQPQQEGQLDLILEIGEVDGCLRGALKYNTHLFDKTTIERMDDHLRTLLCGILENPQQSIHSLPVLGAGERRQMLIDWNHTTAPIPEDDCIHQQFERRAKQCPDAIAIVAGDDCLSYESLNLRAEHLARRLQKLGVGPETIVGLCLRRSADMAVGLLGILKAGGAYLPLDPSYPRERLAYMISDAGLRVLVTNEQLSSRLPPFEGQAVCVDRDLPDRSDREVEAANSGVTSGNLAYVIYTSGSAGRPKGVMIEHQNVINFFSGMDAALEHEAPGTWLAVTSVSFDISVLELLWTLTRGFKVVVHAEQGEAAAAILSSTKLKSGRMDFSLFYFSTDEGNPGNRRYDLLLEGARFADERGFTAVWTPERHFHAFGGLYPNPSVTSAAIAMITRRIRIRAGSVVLPLHHPVRVAEEWAVVDNLSDGRVEISFASGWHSDDFIFQPDNFANRHDVLRRGIDQVRRLWRGESLKFRTGTGAETEIKSLPRPVQIELPVWVTAAGSPETFRLAGKLGAGLLTHLLGQTLEELADKISIYRNAWLEAGRRHGASRVALMLHTYLDEDLEQVREDARQPFYDYLRSSLSLIGNLARTQGDTTDLAELQGPDMEALLARAYQRYFEGGALLGTPETCLKALNRLQDIGIDEVACLIDFGVDFDSVKSSLERLAMLKERFLSAGSRSSGAIAIEDESPLIEIARYGVTHLQCTPSMARLLTIEHQPPPSLRSLRKLLLGGEALPAELARQMKALVSGDLINMYGPTETTIWSASHEVRAVDDTVPIGMPITNTRIHILDEYGQMTPAGVRGELFIGGRGVARGYLNSPSLTSERFIPDPFSHQPGARIYRTGDMACYQPDGAIRFLGRADNQVKLRGYRIELGEIETILEQHVAVREAVVVAREEAPGDHRLVAYVVPNRPGEAPASSFEPVASDTTERLRTSLPNGLSVYNHGPLETMIIYREIYEDEIYLKHGINLRDGDCIFDVGANIGLFSLFVNERCSNAKLFCFEPIPPTFELLQRNLNLHGIQARSFQFGISDREEEASFTFYPRAAGLSGRFSDQARDRAETRAIILNQLQEAAAGETISAHSREQLDALIDESIEAQRFNCRLRTLSDVINENAISQVDLLKIDVEGSELHVLRGIDDQTWPLIRQVAMEVHSRELLDGVKAILARRGFNVFVDEIFKLEATASDPANRGRDIDVYMLYAIQRAFNENPAGRNGNDRAGAAATFSIGNMKEYLKQRLPAYMVPAAFVVMDTLPLTPNGKVDRSALPKPVSGKTTARAKFVAARSPNEKLLAEIWRRILKTDQVGVHDNFFELGGQSLLAVEMVLKVREEFRVRLPANKVFEAPTIAQLAESVEEAILEEISGLSDEEAEQLLARTDLGGGSQDSL